MRSKAPSTSHQLPLCYGASASTQTRPLEDPISWTPPRHRTLLVTLFDFTLQYLAWFRGRSRETFGIYGLRGSHQEVVTGLKVSVAVVIIIASLRKRLLHPWIDRDGRPLGDRQEATRLEQMLAVGVTLSLKGPPDRHCNNLGLSHSNLGRYGLARLNQNRTLENLPKTTRSELGPQRQCFDPSQRSRRRCLLVPESHECMRLRLIVPAENFHHLIGSDSVLLQARQQRGLLSQDLRIYVHSTKNFA